MRRNFQYIIGDFDLNEPLSKYSLVSARNMMSDIALRVELPEGVQLSQLPPLR